MPDLVFRGTDGVDRVLQHLGVRVQQIHPITYVGDGMRRSFHNWKHMTGSGKASARPAQPCVAHTSFFLTAGPSRMLQTYASLSLLAAFSAYCFTDAKGVGKSARVLAVAMVVAFVVIEAIALIGR
jgi:hypothetical protein